MPIRIGSGGSETFTYKLLNLAKLWLLSEGLVPIFVLGNYMNITK